MAAWQVLYTRFVIDDAERTLVIILAAALAVLLVAAIIAIIKLIKLLNILKRVGEKAEHVAEAAESLSNAIPKAFGSFAIGKIISKVLKTMMNKSTKGKRGK